MVRFIETFVLDISELVNKVLNFLPTPNKYNHNHLDNDTQFLPFNRSLSSPQSCPRNNQIPALIFSQYKTKKNAHPKKFTILLTYFLTL